MAGRAIAVPEAVRQKAESRGAQGRRWLENLGDLILDLEREWRMTVGATLHGGSESYVAAATTEDGSEAVVKIEMPPHTSFAGEALTLAAAEGRGYARVLARDEDRGAMLLERLGPSLRGSGLPVSTRIHILCSTLREAWRVPPPAGLPTGAEKARWLSGFISRTWEELDGPCSRRVVDRALEFAATRHSAFDPERSVLVHGDAHDANALRDPRSTRTSFKLVDPDGLLAEPAYDLGVLMREWSGELLAGDAAKLGRERCERLAALTGLDPRAIWEWGFVERVSTGLLATRVGATHMGGEMLAVAEVLAAERDAPA